MNAQLNVLLVESDPGLAATARDELVRAGHVVHTCHDADGSAFPCNALADGHVCPLERAPIDVTLDVRRTRVTPTVHEDGVTCALRRHVPLVVAGSAAPNPFDPFAAEVIDRTFDVVDACERVGAAPAQPQTDAADAALREVLTRRDSDLAGHAVVRRRYGGLAIEVSGAGALDAHTKSIAASRMSGAVRAVDSYSRGIDVLFEAAS